MDGRGGGYVGGELLLAVWVRCIVALVVVGERGGCIYFLKIVLAGWLTLPEPQAQACVLFFLFLFLFYRLDLKAFRTIPLNF